MHYKNVFLLFLFWGLYWGVKSEVERSFSYIKSYLSNESILTRFHLYLSLSKLLNE